MNIECSYWNLSRLISVVSIFKVVTEIYHGLSASDRNLLFSYCVIFSCFDWHWHPTSPTLYSYNNLEVQGAQL